MADDFYSAFMLRGNIGATTDIKAVTAPGMYAVASGNASAPDSVAGVLVVLPPTTAPKLKFIKENDWNAYSLVDGNWFGLGSAAGHDEGDFLLTSGGAMTGPIGFPVDNDLSSYALNRQSPASIWDVYKSLTVMNSSWNRIGVIDSKIQFGRAILTIYGSNSHDVGMAVQTGFVMIDIIGTDKKAPGCTLTYYRPDEAKGSSIVSAIVSANPNDGTKYDLWVQTQSAVAGLMMVGQQSFPDFFKPYDPIGHTTTEPTPATPTGVVNLVTANKDGKVNIKGELTVNAGTSLKQGVTVTNGAIIYGEMNSVMNRTENYPNGTYVNGGLVRSFMFGRGANADARGAFTSLYIQEFVGSHNQAVLNLNGFGNDNSWLFRNDGSFRSPGAVFSGNSYMTGDGNIWGTRWNANGQWLWDAIIELVNGRVDWGAFNNFKNSVVTSVRLSGLVWGGKIGNDPHDWGGGQVITAVHAWENYAINMEFGLRTIQVLINGQWLNVASL